MTMLRQWLLSGREEEADLFQTFGQLVYMNNYYAKTVVAGWPRRRRSGPTFAAPPPPPDVSCSAQLLSEHAYHYAALPA